MTTDDNCFSSPVPLPSAPSSFCILPSGRIFTGPISCSISLSACSVLELRCTAFSMTELLYKALRQSGFCSMASSGSTSSLDRPSPCRGHCVDQNETLKPSSKLKNCVPLWNLLLGHFHIYIYKDIKFVDLSPT